MPNHVRPTTFLFTCIKPYKYWYLIMLLGPVIGGFYSPLYNYAIKLLINVISFSSNFTYASLTLPLGIFILSRVSLELGWKINEIARWKAEPLAKKNILLKAYDLVQNSEYKFFQSNTSGNIASKFKGLIDSYEAISKEILQSGLFSRLCKNIVSILAIMMVNIYLGLFIFLWSAIFSLIIFRLSKKLSKASFIDSQCKHGIIGIISDKIINILSILLFSAKKRECEDLEQHLDNEFIPRQKDLYKSGIKLQLVAGLLYILKFTTVIIVMIWLKKQNLISLGDFAFVFGVMLMLADGIYQATLSLQDFIKAINDWKSSVSILHEPGNPTPLPVTTETIKGDIIFDKINFSYNNAPVFKDFSLTIKEREKVGIVGLSGSGKSTLIYLLLRLFPISSGSIYIGSTNINDIDLDALRSNITLIPQDHTLFHKTIFENIKYGKQTATEEEIIEAAKKAHIHSFITELEHGYQTQVGDRGGKLSGGQKQRIVIARAILKNSPILMLDEATSALDKQTEADIQESLDYLMQNKTVMVIAHKLNTLKNMDKVIVLEKGVIVKMGKYEELMRD